jgi:hypothetical protein
MSKKLLFLVIFHLLLVNTTRSQVFEETDGVLAVEAEHFFSQTHTEIRKWYIITKDVQPIIYFDDQESHASTASGLAYIKILPDTRRSHDDPLRAGENFTEIPGQIGVVSYNVYINNPGKYYVWVRAYSQNSEDNGIHVGLNGDWPESGKRMQWCDGKHQWTWGSNQRTQEVHCGVEGLIYLNIDEPGRHVISFSMREDGFEFDKFVLSKKYTEPVGKAPIKCYVSNDLFT